MSLKEKLEQLLNGKNASYISIARYLINRKSYAGLKLKDVGRECHVSSATVVRFCQNLGFDGFADLKYHLTHELEKDRSQFEADIHISRENPRYWEMILDACKTSEQLFGREKQERFLELLEHAREIILIGLGTSYLSAKDFEIRFTRIGLKCRAIDDIILQKFAIKNTDENSLVIVFCYSGATSAVMDNLRLARSKNAKTILWTCEDNAPLEKECDLTIFIHSPEPSYLRNSTSSRIAIFFIIDLVYFAYINRKNIHLENYMDS